MKYLSRFLEKNGLIPGLVTDRNDRNPLSQSLHASGKGQEKTPIPPADPLTETTETVSVVFVSDPGQGVPEFSWPPRPAELAAWPIERRERWGRLANRMEDDGVPFPESERRAFHEIKAAAQAAGGN